jgi:RNA polymerase sigma-70 factor (ECF subfamily)
MEPDTTTEADLLARARSGSEQAVGALLEHHRPDLVAAVRRRLDRAISQRVDASDIVQDVLLEASQRLADYLREPNMPFSLWLRHLARDRIIDMHRRHRQAERRSVDREQSLSRKRSDSPSSVDLMGQLSDPNITPAAAALRREFQSRFLDVLGELEPVDRDVLMMRHFEHMTNSEVAEVLGLSQPAAGMRYLRALRRVRAILTQQEPPSTQVSPGPV